MSTTLYCLANTSWFIENFSSSHIFININDIYQKQTPRNRFTILSSNGIISLTIPVDSTSGKRTFYRDIQISKEFQPKKILTALRSAYGKSPYFDFAYPDLETLFLNHNKNLFDFNTQLLEWSLTWCTNPLSVSFCEGDAVKADLQIEYLPYLQVFADRFPFQPNLSILDIVFNKGRFNISELGNVKKS